MAATSTLPVVLQSGLAADRPAAGDVGVGALYVSTDTGVIEQTDGSSWNTWLDLSSVLGGSFQPLDSDLTAIAALSTSSYGRNLLTLANVAALYTALSVDTDGTLAANSDTKLASQKAVKTYADALLGAAHALEYKGATDCSGNPNYPSAAVGDLYMVSVSGKIGGASGISVSAGDLFVCITANAGGTQASVGADWDVVHATATGSVTGPGSATSGDFAQFDGTTGSLLEDTGLALDTDTGLAANSDSKIPSQKAVKTYVDTATGGLGAGDVLNTIASSGSSLAIDYTDGDVQDITLTADCTFSLTGFTNAEPDFLTLILRQDGTGSRTITWPTITWIGSGIAPTLQTAAGSVDTVVLFSVDGGTTVYGIAQTSQSGLRSGTSFPGSPSDGDLFYRTDRDILYFYKGSISKWLSVDRKYVGIGVADSLEPISATATLSRWPVFEDVYIEEWAVSSFVATTTNGSNYWTLSLNEISPGNVSSVLGSVATNADTHDQWEQHVVSIGVVVASASYAAMNMRGVKTGSPGTLLAASTLVVRSVG